jgi:6-phosphogluconate dehydrogenase
MSATYSFGMVGLGVMGSNFLLNMADQGFGVIGYDQDEKKTAALQNAATPGTRVLGVNSLAEMIAQLESPKRVMMLVPAGKPVDDVIESLWPLLGAGDVIIDGGNSHFPDTQRRAAYLDTKQIHFMGMGVSGGEEGARRGPSIMPGGNLAAWEAVKPMLEAVAAKVEGRPCVAYLGKGAAGQYVKMVHNGIEYAMMQLIAESYGVLKAAGKTNDELHEIFRIWNQGDLQSYLIEITAAIFLQEDEFSTDRLVDRILDQAGAKGTGKWTSQHAMDLGVPVPTIDMAVTMRNISAQKKERVELSNLYEHTLGQISDVAIVQKVHDALYVGMLVCYAQGLSLIAKASQELNFEVPALSVVQVWKGGCIIRSAMLPLFEEVFERNPQIHSILLDEAVVLRLKPRLQYLRDTLQLAFAASVPVAALSTVLGYLDSMLAAELPINLLQAQRDYFGAHTYERTDRPGKFHTQWNTIN